MPLTNNAIQAVITDLFGDVTLAIPGTYYLGLSYTVPTQAKGISTPFWNFTEPTSGVGNYGRLAIVNNTTNFGAIASEPTSGYSVQNNVSFAMPTSSGAWSTGTTNLTYAGLWDALTGGNLWAYGALNPAVPGVNTSGVIVTFAVAQFLATFT